MKPYLPKGVTPAQQREFPTELNLIRDKAMRLGLLATAQKLDAAIKQVGWELAGDVTGMERAERTRRRVCTCSARFVDMALHASHAASCALKR